jgi:hypothetical protein
MKWVRDNTRRFQRRPYYAQQEIDVQCEDIVARFLKNKGGSPSYPISTDDLTVMIEQDVSDLDLYANLSAEGRDIEGVCEFHRGSKPSVRIARYLLERPSGENRFRSTLAHEYGHVVFHNFLWMIDSNGSTLNASRRRSPRCQRTRIVLAPQSDWMEWLAGYAGGAPLMPITHLKELVADSLHEWGLLRRVEADTNHHKKLLGRIAEAFAVSKDAAKTRLHKLGYVTPAAERTAQG